MNVALAFGLNIQTLWLEGAVGFVCTNLPEKAVSILAKDLRISLIEDDFVIHDQVVSGTQNACLPPCAADGSDYTWNLDRIDEPDYHNHDGKYHMCPEGRSVYAYVIDKGVRADHEQFNLNEPFDRVVKSVTFDNPSASAVDDTTNGCAGSALSWHGTAVASVLAGTQVGGAKTNVISVRVWDCGQNSLYSWMISAVNWIGNSTDDNRNNRGVVNYSGGWAPWAPDSEFEGLKAAIISLVRDRHKPFFVSANNFAGDACQFSPNELAYTNVSKSDRWVFVVGGTSFGPSDLNDYRWQEWDGSTPRIGVDYSTGVGAGSNAGGCVSMYAPATDILGARNSGPTDYGRASGTSFAAPLAAAVAARYMEKYNLNPTTSADVLAIYDYLLNTAATTGTPLYNVNTVEFWMCATIPWSYYRTDPGSCPSGTGLRGSTTPIHFPSVGNDSNAGILYSNLHIGDPNCP